MVKNMQLILKSFQKYGRLYGIVSAVEGRLEIFWLPEGSIYCGIISEMPSRMPSQNFPVNYMDCIYQREDEERRADLGSSVEIAG